MAFINHFADTANRFLRSSEAQKGLGKITGGIESFMSGKGGKAAGALSAGMGFIHSDQGRAGAFYGGLAGGVGGMMSSDRDMGLFTGAAMGATAGYRTAKGGIRNSSALGAGLGGLYGAVSDDTSILGGAMMGAAAFGSGMRYGRGAMRYHNRGSGKRMSDMAHTVLGPNRGKQGSRRVGRKRSMQDTGRATFRAMTNDVGKMWVRN